MKAIVCTKYGSPDVLQLQEVAKPELKENQVLVKVYAASANALDYRRFEKLSSIGRFMEERIIKSVGKVFGADIAGIVEKTLEKVPATAVLTLDDVLATDRLARDIAAGFF